MTDHTPTSHDGDHDPAIADRFRVLERVTPPDVGHPTIITAAPGGSNGFDPSGRRSGFLLAVAACVGVVVLGIAALVAVNSGSGDGSEADLTGEAGEAAENPVVADDASETTAALIVEGDAGVRSTTRSEAEHGLPEPADGDGDGPTDGDTDGASAGSSGGNDSTSAADDGGSDPAPSPSAGSTGGGSAGPSATVTDSPGVMPAADGDRPVSTFSTATTDGLPTTGGGTGDTGATVALRGTVTEVFTDCVSRLLLTETGQVVQGGPVSCDGGSYIVVDGTRVFTSSGYTSADLAYDKHPSNLKPGREVSVTATRTGGSTGPLTLACDSCRVRIL